MYDDGKTFFSKLERTLKFCYHLLLFDIGKEEPINIDVGKPVRNTDMKCSDSNYLRSNEDSITVSVGVMPFLSSRYYYKILLPMDKFACLKIDLCLVVYSPGFVEPPPRSTSPIMSGNFITSNFTEPTVHVRSLIEKLNFTLTTKKDTASNTNVTLRSRKDKNNSDSSIQQLIKVFCPFLVREYYDYN
uniref:Uncharacterized protein n=1 Tax=Glossina pallidipes TaxID=7398 RepID=A0A1A9ZCH1_GLOPL